MSTPANALHLDLSGTAVLFVGDVHLGGFSRERNQQLESDFLALLHEAEQRVWRIVLLGDITDYFMEYDGWIPECGTAVYQWFSAYHRRGNPPAIMISGNHDNWSTNFYARCGFLLTHEYAEIRLDHRTMWVLHGDGVRNPDWNLPRPRFHRFLRNPYFIKVFQYLTTPTSGNRVMYWFSKLNRSIKGEADQNFVRLDTWARESLTKQQTDIILCGHHHHPRFEKINSRLYVNTGAFFLTHTCATYNTTQGFQLVSWDSSCSTFTTLFTE